MSAPRSVVPTATVKSPCGVPPGGDTQFRIASITKTMTAAVIVLLAQEGKLQFSDPVSKYVPNVPNGENITIAQLLKMRSGLYGYMVESRPARLVGEGTAGMVGSRTRCRWPSKVDQSWRSSSRAQSRP